MARTLRAAVRPPATDVVRWPAVSASHGSRNQPRARRAAGRGRSAAGPECPPAACACARAAAPSAPRLPRGVSQAGDAARGVGQPLGAAHPFRGAPQAGRSLRGSNLTVEMAVRLSERLADGPFRVARKRPKLMEKFVIEGG